VFESECVSECMCACVCDVCMGHWFLKCRRTVLPFSRTINPRISSSSHNNPKETSGQITFRSAVIMAESRAIQNPRVQFHRHVWYWSHAICRRIFIVMAN